jgi:hypothetical protein
MRLEKTINVRTGVTVWRIKSTFFLYGPFRRTRRGALLGWLRLNFWRDHEVSGKKLYGIPGGKEGPSILDSRIANAATRPPVPNDKRRLPDLRP